MFSGIGDAIIVLCCVQCFHTLVTIGLVREIKALQQNANHNGIAKNKLQPGATAPQFSLVDVRSGDDRGLELTGRGEVLLFLSPTCSFCIDIVRNLHKRPREILSRLTVVCLAPRSECKQLLKRYPLGVPLLSDSLRSVARQYGVSTVPDAVVITPRQKILGYAHPLNGDEVISLLSDPLIDSEPTGEEHRIDQSVKEHVHAP